MRNITRTATGLVAGLIIGSIGITGAAANDFDRSNPPIVAPAESTGQACLDYYETSVRGPANTMRENYRYSEIRVERYLLEMQRFALLAERRAAKVAELRAKLREARR